MIQNGRARSLFFTRCVRLQRIVQRSLNCYNKINRRGLQQDKTLSLTHTVRMLKPRPIVVVPETDHCTLRKRPSKLVSHVQSQQGIMNTHVKPPANYQLRQRTDNADTKKLGNLNSNSFIHEFTVLPDNRYSFHIPVASLGHTQKNHPAPRCRPPLYVPIRLWWSSRGFVITAGRGI